MTQLSNDEALEDGIADPDVFEPPGGSVSQRYGSGSGSFYHKKVIRKTSTPTVL